MANQSEVTGWFTINGVHIPIMKGESKAAAAKKFINSKHREKYDDSKYKYLPDNESEARDKFYEMSDECRDKLTDYESSEIDSLYIGKFHSQKFNEALRNDWKETKWLDEENFNKLVNIMDKACSTYTAKEDMASIRFVNTDYLTNAYGIKDKGAYENYKQMKEFIGSELSSKGYTSVSLNKGGDEIFNYLPVEMKINLPKNTKMYVSNNIKEHEAILGRNTKMVLKDIKFKESDVKGSEKDYGKILLTYEVVR